MQGDHKGAHEELFQLYQRETTPEVKREMEHGRDEVRIMTVHAAKGLEFPVVVVACLAAQFNMQDLREDTSEDSQGRIENLMELVSAAREDEGAAVVELLLAGGGAAADAHAAAVTEALLDRHGTGRIVFRNTRRNVSGFPSHGPDRPAPGYGSPTRV